MHAGSILLAPVGGTLTSGSSSPSRPPFGTADNQFTSRLIRMPASAAEDPTGLLQRPFPTSAWFTNLLWGPAGSASRGEDPVQVGEPESAACATSRWNKHVLVGITWAEAAPSEQQQAFGGAA
jgi:hypothetical protein